MSFGGKDEHGTQDHVFMLVQYWNGDVLGEVFSSHAVMAPVTVAEVGCDFNSSSNAKSAL